MCWSSGVVRFPQISLTSTGQGFLCNCFFQKCFHLFASQLFASQLPNLTIILYWSLFNKFAPVTCIWINFGNLSSAFTFHVPIGLLAFCSIACERYLLTTPVFLHAYQLLSWLRKLSFSGAWCGARLFKRASCVFNFSLVFEYGVYGTNPVLFSLPSYVALLHFYVCAFLFVSWPTLLCQETLAIQINTTCWSLLVFSTGKPVLAAQ